VKRLSNDASVFSAEACAILLAIVMWLPSHVVLAGNVAAGAAARAALTFFPASSAIPYSDLKLVINSHAAAK
jgi:hypothetical protein